jgi:hypothetical protein
MKFTVDGVSQLDFLYNPLSKFEMTYDPDYYRVIGEDDMRADKISDKAYGTPEFWWVVLLVNDLDNPFLDIDPGTVLTIPNRIDIYNFQKKYRLRRS